MLIVLGLLVSLGTAGVPGTATVTAATVLVATGLPLELLAVTLPISTIADMARTLANVTAAGVSSTIVARQEGLLDDAVFAAGGSPDAPDEATDAPATDAAEPATASGTPSGDPTPASAEPARAR